MGHLETYRADDSSPICLVSSSVHGWWLKADNVTTLLVGSGMLVDVLMRYEDVCLKLRPKRSPTKKEPAFRNKLDEQHFGEVWRLYPRKDNKQAATRAWAATCHSRPALPILLEAIERAKRSQQWQDLSLVPHLSTWINGRRWEDETIMQTNGQTAPSVSDVLEELDDVRNTFRIV